MAKVSGKWMGGGLWVALGVAALSPLQFAGIALSVAGVGLWSGPALAQQTNIPGVGMVVKKKPGNSPIIVPSDNNGVVRLTGLEAGEYEVKLLGDSAPVTMAVGKDGRLAFVALREGKGAPAPKITEAPVRGMAPVGRALGAPVAAAVPPATAAVAAPVDPRARRAMPAAREWVQAVEFGEEGGSGTIIAIVAAAAEMPDVNTSSVEQLMKGTNISREAAAFIVGERKKGGPYKDPLNFAQRVGNNVTVDFGYSSARIGDTMIIAKGTNPKADGFKTNPGSGVVELYGKQHNYVGHVTLLR